MLNLIEFEILLNKNVNRKELPYIKCHEYIQIILLNWNYGCAGKEITSKMLNGWNLKRHSYNLKPLWNINTGICKGEKVNELNCKKAKK